MMNHDSSYRKRLTGYDVPRRYDEVRVKAATHEDMPFESWGNTCIITFFTVLGCVLMGLLA